MILPTHSRSDLNPHGTIMARKFGVNYVLGSRIVLIATAVLKHVAPFSPRYLHRYHRSSIDSGNGAGDGYPATSVSTTSVSTVDSKFEKEVTAWLDEESVPWRYLSSCDNVAWEVDDTATKPVIAMCKTQRHLPRQSKIEEGGMKTQPLRPSFWLHLIPSPQSLSEALPPTLTRRMTDACVAAADTAKKLDDTTPPDGSDPDPAGEEGRGTEQVVHLHEDVWYSKNAIAKSRLLSRLGRINSRVYARKTIARRIDKATATAFLEENHLWGAVRAKFNYGLYLKEKKRPGSGGEEGDGADAEEAAEKVLVAVASFGPRRRVLRAERSHASHELIRFCTRRDGQVVGGITKLIKCFARKHDPDDVITVIDRDWGTASGWVGIGFETVNVMPSLIMAVGREDGVRRHLVGSGIRPSDHESADLANKDTGTNGNKQGLGSRPGLPSRVLEQLSEISRSDWESSLQCMSSAGFNPVYDAGVERLMLLTSAQGDRNDSALELWSRSVPTYATSYYSDNSGIWATLARAKDAGEGLKSDHTVSTLEQYFPGANDSLAELQSMASWRDSLGSSKTSRLVLSAPSSLGGKSASIEVQERSEGWRTVALVRSDSDDDGDNTKLPASIYHGVYCVDPVTRFINPKAVGPMEYLRTMASISLALLQLVRGNHHDKPYNFLHLGLGAGTLPRLIHHYLPDSRHHCVELDEGMAVVTERSMGMNSNIRVEIDDAISWVYSRAGKEGTGESISDQYDCIFVDIFGADGQCPVATYDERFLTALQSENIIRPNGFILQNLHSGGKRLACQLENVKSAYVRAFNHGSCLQVESLDSKPNAGNRVFVGSKSALFVNNDSIESSMVRAASVAGQRWGLDFDAASRVRGIIRTRETMDDNELRRWYFERIGISREDGAAIISRDPNAEDLQRLFTAHLLHVPFENCDQHSHPSHGGMTNAVPKRYAHALPSLDVRRSLDKIIWSRRGGFCFELNLSFVWLLRSLGYRARLALADVGRRQQVPGHVAILVDGLATDEGGIDLPLLVDPGFGDPGVCEVVLPVSPDGCKRYEDPHGDVFRFRREEGSSNGDTDRFNVALYRTRVRAPDVEEPMYRFHTDDDLPYDAKEFQDGLYRVLTTSDFFTNNRVCVLSTESGLITLKEDCVKWVERGKTVRVSEKIDDHQKQKIVAYLVHRPMTPSHLLRKYFAHIRTSAAAFTPPPPCFTICAYAIYALPSLCNSVLNILS